VYRYPAGRRMGIYAIRWIRIAGWWTNPPPLSSGAFTTSPSRGNRRLKSVPYSTMKRWKGRRTTSPKTATPSTPGRWRLKDPFAWVEDNVKHILAREEYLGHVVNFRVKKVSFKSKKQEFLPKEHWRIFENVHEPIVEKETWELVQQLRKTKRRRDSFGEVNPLTGLMVCAGCGSKMYHHRSKNGKHDYYECSNYALSRQRFDTEPCSPHSVPTHAVREIILEAIRKTTAFVREHEDEFVKMIRDNSSCKQGETLKTHGSKITKNERRIAELDKMFYSLYEDKVTGAITPERFAQMSFGFEREQSALKEENTNLKAEVAAFNEDNQRADNFVSLVWRYTRFEKLTTPIINEFVLS